MKDLPEYICIKIGLLEKDITKAQALANEKHSCYILVEHFSQAGKAVDKSSAPKREILAEKVLDPTEYNFSQRDINKLRILYNRRTLSLYLWKGDSMGISLLDLELKIDNFVHLDMGRAFVGFLPDSYNSYYCVDILEWSMKGYNVFNSQDPWNGLTIKYLCSWPVTLVLSEQVLERYSNLFRLFFPIKFLEIQLHKTWLVVSQQLKRAKSPRLFRLISALRNKMNFFIGNVWSYLHIDVLETQWKKLLDSLNNLTGKKNF